jgi:hypothetical protein
MAQHKKMARNSSLQTIEFKAEMARPAGFEPTTPWFVAKGTISDNQFKINTLRSSQPNSPAAACGAPPPGPGHFLRIRDRWPRTESLATKRAAD